MSKALRSRAELAAAGPSSPHILVHMETFDMTPANTSYKRVSRLVMSYSAPSCDSAFGPQTFCEFLEFPRGSQSTLRRAVPSEVWAC